MLLDYYNNRRSVEEIVNGPRAVFLNEMFSAKSNFLIMGDNAKALRALAHHDDIKGKVTLVYIDPPFATKNEFRIGAGRTSTMSRSKSDPIAYSDAIIDHAFLDFLYERLILIRELMADDASIYLHIDSKIGHYVKIVMDDVFGRVNFRNDISRIKCNPKNFDRRAYGNVKDMILFYTKTERAVWNDPRLPLDGSDLTNRFNKTDEKGRHYATIPLHAPGETNGKTGQPWRGILPPAGRHWRSAPETLEALDKQGLIEWSKNGNPRKRMYLDESAGKKIQDIWEFKDPQYPNYPTEKNLEMLKLIIAASSNEGDLVLDCFAGSGTTLLASHELKRHWIGIDQSEHAIKVAKERLESISDTASETEVRVFSQIGTTAKREEKLARQLVGVDKR